MYLACYGSPIIVLYVLEANRWYDPAAITDGGLWLNHRSALLLSLVEMQEIVYAFEQSHLFQKAPRLSTIKLPQEFYIL